MPAKKLPDTDEGRIKALEIILEREEKAEEGKTVLSLKEIYNLKSSLSAYKRSQANVQQALNSEADAKKNYIPLFQNTQLYISHFIQVLYLTVIRNEIKAENLSYYGLKYSDNFTVPNLLTEEAVIEWGERLINGETTRISHGGAAIYNPTITKVKVHYDLFKEIAHSLKIYRQNIHRLQEGMTDLQDKADNLIWTAWTKVEFTYGALPSEKRDQKYNDYGIQFYHQTGKQLDVFD